MKNKFLKALILASSTLTAASIFASDENIEVTPIQDVTQHELAAIYVLSEICPNMVDQAEQDKFAAGYSKLVKEYLPNEKNPVARLEILSQDVNFKSILAEAETDAKNAGDAKNKEICKELTTYNN